MTPTPADPLSARGALLLVDDEERLLKSLGRALRDEGHEVVTAQTAAEAERRLAERGFDVLVVDNRMPGRTGLELVRDLAATPEGERLYQLAVINRYGEQNGRTYEMPTPELAGCGG